MFNSNSYREMKIYDLMWGNFDILQVVNNEVPSLKAYYPFYLYRSGYSVIPDATNLSRPFIKEDSTSPTFQNIQSSTCYLLSNQCQGYITVEDNPNLDVPFIRKTFSVSFDVVSVESLLQTSTQQIDLISVTIRNSDSAYLNKIKVAMTLDLTPSIPSTGTLFLNVNDNNQNINNVYQISSQLNMPSKDNIINNPTVFNRNLDEKNINLIQILSKQTVTLRVGFTFQNI